MRVFNIRVAITNFGLIDLIIIILELNHRQNFHRRNRSNYVLENTVLSMLHSRILES